jgi:peptidoglycan/LPS O-acetylase OafA/YrhL
MVQCNSARAWSVHLDFIRGAAAIAVLIYHVRYRCFIDYSETGGAASLFVRLGYVATSFGHDAVIVFFVLSGYFIAGTVVKDATRNQWSWGRYAAQRLVRLYLVLIPGLVLTLFWDQIGLRSFGDNPIYTGAAQSWKQDYFNVPARSTLGSLLGNATFLQPMYVRPYGSNEALWSLSYEFWYYVLFPCLWLALKARRRQNLWLLAVAGVIAWFVGRGIMLYFPIWLFGASLVILPRVRSLHTLVWWRLGLILSGCAFVVLTLAGHLSNGGEKVVRSVIVGDYLTAVGFAAFMYVLLHDHRRLQNGVYERASRRLAAFSFSLYVTHLPLLVLLRAWLIPRAPWEITPATTAYALAISMVCIAYAATFAAFTEKRTTTVRRRVEQILRLTRSGTDRISLAGSQSASN